MKTETEKNKEVILNIDKKEFASLCGIGKSALHNYSSESWNETRMIIESILKDREISQELLKIDNVKTFVGDVKNWLTNEENFFLPMKNKRIGLYKIYTTNLFNIYGLENIQPNQKELSLFMPNEKDKKIKLDYSKAVQIKMSVFEKINILFENQGIEPNREKLISEAKKAQEIILKFNTEQDKRKKVRREKLSDDETNNYYNRIDGAYFSKIANSILNRIDMIRQSINKNRILSDGHRETLLNYCLPENHVIK